ncbi:hypothetical protein E2C01_050800 [Portunus trituberculatus]|uniref:Uncharacterized protein n=1 Tax=Portunus trituberculatus TaxID=210409 RepID=A0A5B7GJY0_PORTR|nr:hypothetical protein [Portunus trituberculatus]
MSHAAPVVLGGVSAAEGRGMIETDAASRSPRPFTLPYRPSLRGRTGRGEGEGVPALPLHVPARRQPDTKA